MSGSGPLIAEMDTRTLAGQTGKLLILPVGALEAHGPQNPLGADSIQAELTAKDLAERLGGLVAPAIAYGVCPGASRFPGTVSLRMDTLELLVKDIVGEFARMGFRRILILSGHGSGQHMAAIREGAQRAMVGHPGLQVAALCDYDYVYELRGTDAPATDGHAGLLETSRLMALVPELVGSDRPVVEYKVNRYSLSEPTADMWPESVIGDTRGASPEMGHRIHAHVLDRLAHLVQEVLPG